MATKILLIDDDPHVLRALSAAFSKEVYDVRVCRNPAGIVDDLAARGVEVVIVELETAGLRGEDFLRAVRRRCPETVVVILTVNPTVEQAVEAMRLGAFDYRMKPLGVGEMVAVVERAVAHRALLASRVPAPPAVPAPPPPAEKIDPGEPMTLELAMERPERDALLRALIRHAWNREDTARELGINRTTLYKKMRKHGLDVGDFAG